jgi:hypothetical protein
MATGAIAAVGSVPMTSESGDREDILMMRRTEDMFHAKMRLCIDYF